MIIDINAAAVIRLVRLELFSMGDLNNIQNEIALEMLGDLADVSYAFTGTGIRSNNAPYDPANG